MSNDKLAQLVRLYMSKGYDAVDASELAHTALVALSEQVGASPSRNGNTLARQEGVVSFPSSPEGGNVDYGDETPEQAKQRWLQQERNDPQGLFTGGSSCGGVFGQGAIATSDYDPEAVDRTEERMARQVNLNTQHEMLKTLGQMNQHLSEQRRALPTQEEEPRGFLPSFSRRLARRRR